MKKIILMLALCATVGIANAQQSAAKTAFNKTLEAYFDLKNGLAKDNVNQAAVAAKNLLAQLKSFPTKSLKQQEQVEWTKQAAEINKQAVGIAASKDLALQRKNFESIARGMIKLTRTLQLHQNVVYVQFCPMAKKSWLNEVEEVQNPFYGSKMYDCGEVSETIAK